MSQPSVEEFLRNAPDIIDIPAVINAWQQLQPPYQIDNRTLPLPPWALRPYTENGKQAWSTLQQDLTDNASIGPMCIYMHIPFCTNKCDFCDSYSFKLGAHRATHVKSYVSMLDHEMKLWSRQGVLAKRPVSTVHFGGGTPTFLDPNEFAHIVICCKELFNVSDATEWALESTVADLSPNMLARLHEHGFRRLHVGVQSMDDPVRQCIGRHTPAHDVAAKIDSALSLGWIVTVDLIVGLPGQTLTDFLTGIQNLAALGVDGFSLYELNISRQNWRWAKQHGLTDRALLFSYLMFQTGCQLLERLGYRKNLFNHWANARDDNRYFTFPTRGEDLLALGTIADGLFGDYHYRHLAYNGYRNSTTNTFPGLEGGLRRTVQESRLQPLITALLAGCIPVSLCSRLYDLNGSQGVSLWDEWLERGLMQKKNGDLCLTAVGSWFAGIMVEQLRQTWVENNESVRTSHAFARSFKDECKGVLT